MGSIMDDPGSQQPVPTDEELERTTIAPTLVAFGVAVVGLLVGFVALSSEHLYVGTIAIVVAVVAAVLGSLWLVNRMLHNRHLGERRMGRR
jgi:hypothetical protein